MSVFVLVVSNINNAIVLKLWQCRERFSSMFTCTINQNYKLFSILQVDDMNDITMGILQNCQYVVLSRRNILSFMRFSHDLVY